MASDPQILSISYARIAVRDPQVSAAFAHDKFGLEQVGAHDGEISFRADHRAQTLTYVPHAHGAESIGIELADEAAFDDVTQILGRNGFAVRDGDSDACRARAVSACRFTRDASGNNIDLILGPRHSATRYAASRDAGITGFHGVALRSTDFVRDTFFWTEILGARVSDRVGNITYLAIDDWHHRVALYPSSRAGILYLAFSVASIDDVMRNQYFLQEHQIKIIQGPGKQAAGGQVFLHLRGPDDIIYAYMYGMVENVGRPRQFALEPTSLCNWGSVCTEVPELMAGLSANSVHEGSTS